MARTRFKWKFLFFVYILFLSAFTKSLPIDTRLTSLVTTDTVFKSTEFPIVTNAAEELTEKNSETTVENKNATDIEVAVNATRNTLLRNIRPGQEVRQYAIEITPNGNSFEGRVILDVVLTIATREDPIELHVEDLSINAVRVGVFTAENAINADFDVDEGILEISPDIVASTYIVIIEYTGSLANYGVGLYRGQSFNDDTYLAMNLHPTHARRVFPCMDEPTESTIISFTINNAGYTNLVANSMLEENSANQFRALQGPPHLWGMVAHNFININIPIANVLLFGRPGVSNQDSQAAVAINFYFTNLNEWTNKPYFEILLNQDGRMHILALPDVSREWSALSTVGIWEPYLFMETVHSVKQRMLALTKIAEAMAKQWFGFVIFPENWRYEWVVSGLASYAGWEMLREFQSDILGTDVSLLDANTLFVTEVIQESLLRDGYNSGQVVEPGSDLFEEDEIRNHIYGIMKYKAPALLRMMRLVLGDQQNDFIQLAGRALLNGRALQTVNSLSFVDALNSNWLSTGNLNVDDIGEYLEPWIWNTGYPLLHVSLLPGRVLVSQERFSFSSVQQVTYQVPITYTTSINPDFSTDNIYPIQMSDSTTTLSMALDEEDWVLFNIQGQGYYRVNYDPDLWERIIEALEEPDRRAQIHPLNRATLVDDALNLARGGRLSYETAFRVVLTMEHETEYAVWKAFVRNMNFLRKRLVALVSEDEDLDPDIYLRMVRRTVGTVENELGFYPDRTLTEPAMHTLTRGLIMDHACRANYQPCIAAAVDWFYDPNNNDRVVNPNIPHEIRPAVYCTMVREGDDQVITALYDRLEIEVTHYERVVILESLACSRDANFIRNLLEETIATNSRYGVEERVKIFIAVAESSYENANIAVNFISMRTAEIRNMYGGAEKLEEVITALAENMANNDLSTDFRIWVQSQNNNLDDSQLMADRVLLEVLENIVWDNDFMDEVYEWIDENDASTLMLSVVALCLSLMVAMFNH